MDSFEDIDGPRFFRLVRQLPKYEGALRAVLIEAQLRENPPSSVSGGERPVEITDPRLLAGIEYSQGS